MTGVASPAAIAINNAARGFGESCVPTMNRTETIAPPAIALTISAAEIASRPLQRSGCSSGPIGGPASWPPFIDPIALSSLSPRYTNGSDQRKARSLHRVEGVLASPPRVHHRGDVNRAPEQQRLLHHLIDREEIAGTDRKVEARERHKQHRLRRQAAQHAV